MNLEKEGHGSSLGVWGYVSRGVTILEVFSLTFGFYFIWVQLKNITYNQEVTSQQNSSEQAIREIQFLREFKTELTTGVNKRIYESIVNGRPILVENGGGFTDTELKEYLSLFNELSFVTGKDFISGNVIWSFFYFYIAHTFESGEVQKFLKTLRKDSPGRFGGLDELYQYIKEH